ncbi:MAG: GntR family transcriptional regulator [Acetobacteraceae bacterium]
MASPAGTVRAALAFLEREGLVNRRRGAGTRVLEQRAPPGFGQTLAAVDALIQYARDTKRLVRSTEAVVVDQAMAAVLGVAPGSHWTRIRNLRIDPAHPLQPLCANDSYVHADLAGIVAHLGDETSAVCDLIERHYGVRTHVIEQELQGALIPPELAEPLASQAGTPALRILRRYRDATGWLFETTVSLHPADRFAYRMRLDRATPPEPLT